MLLDLRRFSFTRHPWLGFWGHLFKHTSPCRKPPGHMVTDRLDGSLGLGMHGEDRDPLCTPSPIHGLAASEHPGIALLGCAPVSQKHLFQVI